ncbi:MAG TPA: TlpA disulfide reductase family protein [Methylobacterium sp.]|jgi:thiol-disulfide isomerase/thioredoxin
MTHAAETCVRRALGKRRLLAIVIAVLAAMAGATAWVARSFDGPMAPPLHIVGAITVTMPNGESERLGNLVRPGVPTVIALWASWCGPCRSEAPHIVELRRRFGPGRLNLVYLNARETGVPAATLSRFLRMAGMRPDDYAVISDAHLARLTRDPQNLISRVYLFDPTGRPTATIVGYKPLAFDRVSELVAGYVCDAR